MSAALIALVLPAASERAREAWGSGRSSAVRAVDLRNVAIDAPRGSTASAAAWALAYLLAAEVYPERGERYRARAAGYAREAMGGGDG